MQSIKLADFVGQSNFPILSPNIEHLLFLTIKSLDIGEHIFLCYHGDCLQWQINIYFVSYFIIFIYIFISVY